jgi:hypothetical protein
MLSLTYRLQTNVVVYSVLERKLLLALSAGRYTVKKVWWPPWDRSAGDAAANYPVASLTNGGPGGFHLQFPSYSRVHIYK